MFEQSLWRQPPAKRILLESTREVGRVTTEPSFRRAAGSGRQRDLTERGVLYVSTAFTDSGAPATLAVAPQQPAASPLYARHPALSGLLIGLALFAASERGRYLNGANISTDGAASHVIV